MTRACFFTLIRSQSLIIEQYNGISRVIKVEERYSQLLILLMNHRI